MATAKASEKMKCNLVSCSKEDDLESHSRVEVKAIAPPKRSNLAILWTADGQATFHRKCWEDISGDRVHLEEDELKLVKEAAKTAEYFDSCDVIEKEAKRIAELLKVSCHAIAFTGAGISTSAGIGDFRGKGGKWTERDRKKQYGKAAKPSHTGRGKGFSYTSLRPTYTHEAISMLVEKGILKYIISQNVDGLHRLSGVPSAQIAELHGNVFHEKCEKCGKRYERTYAPVPVHRLGSASSVSPQKCASCGINHRTEGLCTNKGCKGHLMNTIINFGDSLESEVISNADQNACANDMVLCLGSSLTVHPACDFVEQGNPVRLAICNRQPTPFDGTCAENGSRVYGDCDALMRRVMKQILDEDELKTWETGRKERMQLYESNRQVIQSKKSGP